MKQRWAAEPWKAAENQFFIKGEEGWGSVVNDDDWFIAKIEDSLDPAANAERIVACVNGLKGKNPEAIETVVDALLECINALQSAAPKLTDAAQKSEVADVADRAHQALIAFNQIPGAEMLP